MSFFSLAAIYSPSIALDYQGAFSSYDVPLAHNGNNIYDMELRAGKGRVLRYM